MLDYPAYRYSDNLCETDGCTNMEALLQSWCLHESTSWGLHEDTNFFGFLTKTPAGLFSNAIGHSVGDFVMV